MSIDRFSIKPLVQSFNRGTKFLVEVSNGVPPYTWEVTGTDFSFDNAETSVPYNFITAASDAENNNVEEVTVTDANGDEVTTYCSVCGTDVCCEAEDYSFYHNQANNTFIITGRSTRISVLGGCPPYHWEVEGEGFSFRNEYTNSRYNYLHFDGTELTIGEVTVTDGCDNEAEVDATGDIIYPGYFFFGVIFPEDGQYPACEDDDYEFYFEDETAIELALSGSDTVTINGGRPAVVLYLSNSEDFSFEEVDGGVAFAVATGYSDEITIYGSSSQVGTGLGDVVAIDNCLNLPIHPTGVG